MTPPTDITAPTARPAAPARRGAKTTGRISLQCAQCGWQTSKWVGRCGQCQAWGTVVDVTGSATTLTQPRLAAAGRAQPIDQVDPRQMRHVPTGVGEFDRVLGGGLVPGAVILVAGEPGVGKSTLLLQVAAEVAAASSPGGDPDQHARVLYLTAEESAAQVRLRAERIGAMRSSLYLADETDLATALGLIEQLQPQLIVVDSVQTISSDRIEGAAGNVAQIREVATCLIRAAKTRGVPALLVGHVTKDGSVAGPRSLEHLVDVVCQFEGERHARLRIVRATKNRYGPTDEVGCFDLGEAGVIELPDPSALFLSPIEFPTTGTCVTVTVEGRRPLPVEVQALLAPQSGPHPRRTTHGLDSARVAMMQAVLGSRVRLPVHSRDLYVATVGGARLHEPGADLAVCLAISSALTDQPLLPRTIALGEVGLSGEVRGVTGVSRRLQEAARLGFSTALVPAAAADLGPPPPGLHVIAVQRVADAVTAMWPARERSAASAH